jgi:hypothetical protein
MQSGTGPPVEEVVEPAVVEEPVEAPDEAVAPPVPAVALLVWCAPPAPEVVPEAPVVTLPPHAAARGSERSASVREDKRFMV